MQWNFFTTSVSFPSLHCLYRCWSLAIGHSMVLTFRVHYPRSVCVRTAPGNVNMVAYGKINSRLSPILGHAGPRWRIRLSLHLVLGLPCSLVHSGGVHSVTLFVHLLSLNRAMCPAHPCIPFLITSMKSFTPLWCRIQVLHVSLPYTMTGNTYSLCTFLFMFILAFLPFMEC